MSLTILVNILLDNTTNTEQIQSLLSELSQQDWDGLRKQLIPKPPVIRSCGKCGISTPESALVSIHKIVRSDYAFYCPECAEVAKRYWSRICYGCGAVYYAKRSNERRGFCTDCRGNAPTKETARLIAHIERALQVDEIGDLTPVQWVQTLRDFNYKCAYCQERKYECLEHVVSLGKGAGTTVTNCVPACMICNTRKHSMDLSSLTIFPVGTAARIADYLLSRQL